MLTNSDPLTNFAMVLGFVLGLFVVMAILGKIWK